MGSIGCPETSAINYHYSLRNNPEERSYNIKTPLKIGFSTSFYGSDDK
jgi:hypothetical protein